MLDSELRHHVIEELAFEPQVDDANIGVAAENGIVTLTGHVGSYAEKIAAERAVRRVKGVLGIAQEIEVRFPDSKKLADDEIAARAVAIISWDSSIPKGQVQVKVQHGWVMLTGSTAWFYQKTAAERAVRKLSGVVGVTNHIEVTPQVRVTDVRQRIDAALKRNAEIDSACIRLNVENGKVVIEGGVGSWHERDVAVSAARSVPGVTEVEDHLAIR
ncbi:MAG: BON domain-containing protein [Rhodospirillales bacterium]|nr:BON domain-containing protein [Rhodospirillales bacterium]